MWWLWWSHRACLDMPKDEYFRLSRCDDDWFCQKCILQNFTDSFFSSDRPIENEFPLPLWTISIRTNSITESPQYESTSEEPCDIFKDLRELRKGNSKKPTLCLLNINSLWFKFNDLNPILTDKLCNILIFNEAKLDNSFNDNLFVANGYKFERTAKLCISMIVYYRSDLPIRRIGTLEYEKSESIRFRNEAQKQNLWHIS